MDDSELLARIRSGDREAYAPLVRRYQADIVRFCRSMLSNSTEAEDAAQDVFISAYRALRNFRGDSAFLTWLHRIASNRCLDILRKKWRQKTESWDALIENQGEKVEKLISGGESEASRLENNDLIRRILVTLPPDYRNILILRELQNFTYQEIAEILNCSLDAVKARLVRARRHFSGQLRHLSRPSNV